MIRQPSSVTVAGPSGSGKSELVEQWLRYLNVFQVKPKKIVYAYDRWQPPVRPYAKEGWHSVSSRVTGPQSFDQMVWSDTRRSVGLGRSDGRRGTGQTRVGFVHERFPSSQHHRAVFDARFISPLANSPRRSIAMPITSWRSKTPGIKRTYEPFYCKPFPTVGVKSCPYSNASRPFGYLMLDVHPVSDDRYRLWSHLPNREGKAQVHTLPVDVPAVRKRAATRTRTSTSAKGRRTTY